MRLEEPKIEFVEIEPTDVITASSCPDTDTQTRAGAGNCIDISKVGTEDMPPCTPPVYMMKVD